MTGFESSQQKQCVWIVRYGLTKSPLVEGVGPFDSGLDPNEGVDHAKCIAQRIRGCDSNQPKAVYCSPFLRTVHTAQLISLGLDTPSVRVEEGLTEWQIPSLLVEPSGVRTFPKKKEELAMIFGTIDAAYESLNPPVPDDDVDSRKGAPRFEESEEALLQRCATTFAKILEYSNSESFVLVSHAPCDQALALHLEGKGVKETGLGPWPLGGVTKFSRSINSDKTFSDWNLEYYGNTSHMPGKYKAGLKEWSLPCLASANNES